MSSTRTSYRVFLVLSFILAGTTVRAQTLSRDELKMRNWIQQHSAEETAFLEKVVNISSGTMNVAGVRAVGDVFAKEFQALGFQTRWIAMPPEMKRAGHLFAEHKAKKRSRKTGKTLLLIGHLDTVFEGEGQKWTMLDDSTAKGAGSSDMKGGDVVILYALKAIKAA